MRSNTVSNISDTAHRAASVSVEHLRAAGQSALDGFRDVRDQAAEAAQGKFDDASRAGKAAYRQAVAAKDQSLSSLEDTVTRNPVGSVVAAFGLGIVLGFMARR
ncbi:hypothetical protein [Aestuariivirga sp.]|uniref:hypothetical protein n=1 Tax=Aestuariivirga sp. TaxID=2650926 RepID=UPI0039E3EC32